MPPIPEFGIGENGRGIARSRVDCNY